MDGGNRDEDDGLRAGPASSYPHHPRPTSRHRQQQPAHGHHQPTHQQLLSYQPDHYSDQHQTVEYLSPTVFDPRPGQFANVASYAASNAQAVAANAAASAGPTAAEDPDDFYRNYRGVQSAGTAHPVSPRNELMASALPSNRQMPSLRSNSNGITPKHPAAPAARNGFRPATRSASNPVDDRFANAAAKQTSAISNGYAGVATTSVKDLKKRFDQSMAQQASHRKLPSRTPTGEFTTSTGARVAVNGSSHSPYSREPVADSGRAIPTRGAQRTKFAAEDQVSNNAQSFASRINKPRTTSISSNEKASKSTPHLPPQTSPRPTASSPPAGRSNGLLFGEILPQERDSVTVGFGIEGSRPRTNSDSNIRSPSRSYLSSQASAAPPPTSPDDWYRGMSSPRGNGDASTTSRIPTSHIRTQSDLAGSKAKHPVPTLQTQQTMPSSSRLPMSIRKVSSPSSPSSPVSPRSNSPGPPKRPPIGGGRTTRPQGPPPTTRAKTPTKRSTTPTTRAKTPTSATPVSSRKAPPSQIATPNSSRLNAIITAPPSKTSPTLRSSRPRQPVSAASTASSRMKAVERGRSPNNHSSRTGSRTGSRQDENGSQRRKIDVGPIDFAQRRETIRLAYSKSIRETEAKAARQAAAERRKKVAEAAARAKAETEAQVAADKAALRASQLAKARSEDHTLRLVTPATVVAAAVALPNTLSSDVRRSKTYDSPTLGIPGTFPSFGSPPLEQDEIPQSAVSAATSAVTEFDNEAQTEPALQDSASPSGLGLSVQTQQLSDATFAHEKVEYRSPFDLPVPEEPETPPDEGDGPVEQYATAHQRATYQYPFEDEPTPGEEVAIKISLDPSSPRPASRREQGGQITIPGAFNDDIDPLDDNVRSSLDSPAQQDDGHRDGELHGSRYEPEPEYEPQPYRADSFQTTVTIISRDSGFTPASQPQRESSERTEPQMDSLEDFYVGIGPSMRDNVAALRDSTFNSSEFSDETPQTSAEIQRTPDTSNSLTIPSLLSPANRSSQQSGWTDFSIDSGGDIGDYISTDPTIQGHEPFIRNQTSTRRVVPRPDSYAQEPGFEAQNSVGVSDLEDPSGQAGLLNKHQLPELETGDGFSLPFLSEGATADSVPVLPDHEPPPIPGSEGQPDFDGRQTPSSGYYDQTRPNSYFQDSSRRESEYYAPSMSTPYSVDQMSVDAGQSIGGPTLVEGVETPPEDTEAGRDSLATDGAVPPSKERSRLTQRQMVIKEIIDTESVFVRDMNIVEEIYKGTAEACPKLDSKTVKLIFRNTDEIIVFHTTFLAKLKDGVASVYNPKGRKSPQLKEMREDSNMSDAATLNSTVSGAPSSTTLVAESDDAKDRLTSIGPIFRANVEMMRTAHEGFLRTSDAAAKRLINIQEDPTVKVWLSECNEVAKDLTAAWNLDSLLIKPMQRITKYPNLISQLLQYTPADHPDREPLLAARSALESAILDINKTKKNFELVGQIVGRKRKESDVRAGFARAFGKRVDKLQASSNRPAEDAEYEKLREKFNDDYLRLQVVLRDVEYYTRQASAYVHEFLQYLSAMELVMRLQPSPYPELESKWARFNVSMRDMEKVALDQHLTQVRKHVIEPFELVIKCYQNPSLAMKKRAKRRLDYEKAAQLKKGGKKVDKQLSELVEQYEALNETLKKELPMLSDNTVKIGNICLGNFVNIQAKWFSIWKEKVKVVLEDTRVPELTEVVACFQREFKDMEEQVNYIGILNPTLMTRTSQSTTDEPLSRKPSQAPSYAPSRPSELSPRNRGLSVNSDAAHGIPSSDFAKRHSGHFTPAAGQLPTSPQQYYYRDYYAGLNINGHARGGSGSPITPTPEVSAAGPRTVPAPSGRPSTGRSIDSTNAPRASIDSGAPMSATQNRRDSVSTYGSNYPGAENRRFSGVFHSALPPDETEESRKSSRASSRERAATNSGYNIMWLAASLFEFNIETTKHEAGYPYLTYQAGEIFDVIAEKGELWLAKNQDDPNDLVGWIWSKHFAKLADS